ncbi:MAG TPA: glycosyltransferase family 2 protein [Gaiellaceae bacterium]|jgi:glycosyltransferase involved in cell wall biosynthesis|nr:glycosyltransferase family 2 protein [Gaiellaceae bacterium]
MTGPLVSIVTPSYNQAAFLEETIRSVLEQEYEPIQYVVVDDGSTDASVEIVERYAERLAWWTRQENAGQVAALNRGFERTCGEYMGYLNADDTLLPGAVARMVAELERDPGLWLVYGDALYTDERSRQTGYLPSREFDVVEMVRRCDNHVVQPATLWRRAAWERFGPFAERGWYFFDFEFFLRFPPERVRRVAEPLATYRIHPEAKSTGVAGSRLARDHARLAETFFGGDRLPAAAGGVAREGRSSAYLLGAEFAYEGLDLPLARRYVLRGLRLHPRHASPRWLSLAAKSFLPRAAVAALRRRRRRP